VAARQAATISAADSGASSTFGQERFSSIVTSSRRPQVSAYSCAANPPTEIQSGTSSRRKRGKVSARNASRPGFARPIELSIPASVSAMRTGRLPARGSGVTVFVTKPSSERATPGAVSASRQPEALSSTEYGSFHAEPLPGPLDLDHAAVAGAVAAGHRRLPRQLRVRTECTDGLEHRLGPAAEDVEAGLDQLGHVGRLDDDLGVRQKP